MPGNGSGSSSSEAKVGDEARQLLRAATVGSLATASNSEQGWPYASLVLVACDHDASPILLLSDLAEHSRNIKVDSRVSLLIDGTSGTTDRLTGPRVTIFGKAEITLEPGLRNRFLTRHESARTYADFRDFNFYKLNLTGAHFVAGFGRIHRIKAIDFLYDVVGAAELSTCEPEVLEHMNTDHAEAVALYASALVGAPEKGASLTGIDPEGCDLITEVCHGRLSFDAPIVDAAGARAALIDLVARARQVVRQRSDPQQHE